MVDVLILVVEDNPDHRELIVEALARKCDRAAIATAEDGVDALDFLHGRARHAGRDARKLPRLMIVDLKMARMDGLALLEAVRADPHTTSIPAIVLSASSEKDELDRCYVAGANSVVRKTLDADELLRKVGKMYDFWITVNETNRNSRV